MTLYSLYSCLRPTPVLNTPNFPDVFGQRDGKLKLDERGHLRALEFIALTGCVFEVFQKIFYTTHHQEHDKEHVIYQVCFPAEIYCSKDRLYVDSAFVEEVKGERLKKITQEKGLGFDWHPEKPQDAEKVLDDLLALRGEAYIWGSNVHTGIPELLTHYPYPFEDPLTKKPKDLDVSSSLYKSWTLQGLDCSGLLYEVTKGYTPRNTSDLIHFGKGVAIEGLESKELERCLQPLDLLVWRGHVIIVHAHDKKTGKLNVIESREFKGVVVTPLQERLKEIAKSGRIGQNEWDDKKDRTTQFVVRRWFSC